jgi:GntR family transcriptional regulator/MocR family aminotransferase
VALQPVSDYCRRVALPEGLVIGYSGLDEQELVRQGALLGPLLSAVRP